MLIFSKEDAELNIFKKVSIGRLFFGIFAMFISVIFLIFSWISYTVTSRQLADNTSINQQALLNELNKQLIIQLKSLEQMSLAAVRNIEFIGYDPQESDLFERNKRKENLANSLASVTYSTAMIDSIYLYLNYPISSSGLESVKFYNLEDLKNDKWYSYIENSEFAWIPEHTIKSNVGNIQVISFARQIYISGKYLGVLTFNIKASQIQKLIQGETDGRSRLLFDTGNRIITSIGDPQLNNEVMKKFGEIDEVMRKSEEKDNSLTGSIHLPNFQPDALLVWSRSPSNWVLVEITPWKDIVNGSVKLALILLSVGLIFIVIVSFFTLYLSRQFTKPIKLLVRQMKRLPSESLITDLPTDYCNEFGYLFDGYRKQIERIEELMQSLKSQNKRQRDAEIQALQAMINPHFLYNTLDQLNWMAIDSGQEKISEVLSLMGKMFRIGLSNGEKIISIEDEITHVECYLKIQQIRWGYRLSVEISVDQDIKAFYIPRLTLQPFVENAIIHGFHGRKTGAIRISVHKQNQDIKIEIRDNGVGIRSDWKAPKKKTGGYGLCNVFKRMRAYFSPPYGVDISGIDGEGTRVIILLPQIENKDKVEDGYYLGNSDNAQISL